MPKLLDAPVVAITKMAIFSKSFFKGLFRPIMKTFFNFFKNRNVANGLQFQNITLDLV
jgi:hypothetical protein